MVLLRSMPERPCPWCTEQGGLEICLRLKAKPIGSFSLAGAQVKVSATSTPVLCCSRCKWELDGKFDGDHVTFPDPHVGARRKGE